MKTVGCIFGCPANSNCLQWDPKLEVDAVIESIKDETDVRKIAAAASKCLHIMSLNDACEFMVAHQYPITPINILKFKNIADQCYFARLSIMKELILG